MAFDPRATIDIACPNGHSVPVRLDDARKSATVACPTCQATIEIDGTQFDRTLRDASGS